jgi:tRNA threonylcarbamoyladenosine biosynthesis protein TsaB
VVPVTTLEALALQVLQRGAQRALACLDARMGEVYWGCFGVDAKRGLLAFGPSQVGPPDSVSLPTTGDYQGIGRGFSAYPQLASLPRLGVLAEDARALPHAREILALGSLRLGLGEGIDPAALQPVYLRDKVALTEAERAGR